MTSKDKKFLTILGIITLLIVAALLFLAKTAGTKYTEISDAFSSENAKRTEMESLALYPTSENLAAKQTNLDAFKKNATDLTAKIKAFRPAEFKNSTAQEFTDELVKTIAAAKKHYADSGLAIEGENLNIPAGFALGFDSYTASPPDEKATAVLGYQLKAHAEMHKLLAAAKPASLNQFFRESLPEEKNTAYTPPLGSAYRALPCEISFSGKERSLRAFLQSLINHKEYIYVIRSMRITNDKLAGPEAEDAAFEQAAPEDAPAGGADGGGGFGDFVPADGGADGGAAPAPAENNPAPSASGEQLMKPVLGAENINVFMRIDTLLIHPETTKK